MVSSLDAVVDHGCCAPYRSTSSASRDLVSERKEEDSGSRKRDRREAHHSQPDARRRRIRNEPFLSADRYAGDERAGVDGKNRVKV